MKTIIAAGPAIIEKNRVLLIKDNQDKFWKFPGGTVKNKQNLEQTAIREAKEELSIKVKLIRPLKPTIIYFPDKIFVSIVYLATKSGKIKPAHDIKKWAYLDIHHLPKDIGPNVRPVVAEYLSSKK